LQGCHEHLDGSPAADMKQAAARVLQALSPLEPEFAELRDASLRPFAQFRSSPTPDGPAPSFVHLRSLGYLLALRTSAELTLGQTEAAFADACVIQRLAAAAQRQPTLVGMMVGSALLSNMGLQTLWEGLASGSWSDAQLQQFQALFTSTDLLAGFDHALRAGERAGINYMVEHQPRGQFLELFSSAPSGSGFRDILERLYYRAWPQGWFLQNQIFHNRLLQETGLGNYDVRQHRVYPRRCNESAQKLSAALSGWNPFAELAAVGLPNFLRASERVANTQAAVDEAALACALEHYRRAHGQYPVTLEALLPEFIGKLPHDLITGEPLKYRTQPGGLYLLYSVGWDENDDGGQPEPPSNSLPRQSPISSGDWVWPVTQ
jgi:type II secretory pathway pseudopilin PulG